MCILPKFNFFMGEGGEDVADVLLIGTEETSSEPWSNGGQFGLCRFQAIKSGTLSVIKAYIGTTGGPYHGMVALYADNAGDPGTLLTSCASTEFYGDEPYQKSFPVNPYDIIKDTYYWLAFIGDSRGPFYKSTISGTMKYRGETYSSFSFPSPPEGLGSYSKIFLYSGWGAEAASGNPFYAYAQQ